MSGNVIVEAAGLALTDQSRPFDFKLSEGEIVGLAGLEGHGQSAFLEGLAGLRAPVAGTITVVDGAEKHAISDAHAAFGSNHGRSQQTFGPFARPRTSSALDCCLGNSRSPSWQLHSQQQTIHTGAEKRSQQFLGNGWPCQQYLLSGQDG